MRKRAIMVPVSAVSRRRFLKGAATLSLGMAAFPYVIPSAVWAAKGKSAASNRIVLGFIGMGKIMKSHLGRFLREPQVQIVALCDVESKRLGISQQRVNDFYAKRQQKGSYTGCAIYNDFRDLIGRDDIDAVVIATPDHWHALLCIAALESGKDVYCEKPLSLTINEGKAIVAAAHRTARVFQTGSQQRSERGFRVACELVRNGRIGELHTVHVNVGGPSVECHLPAEPVPEGLDWDMWLGPAPWRPYNHELAPGIEFQGWPNWRNYRDYSGGSMTDWGAHHFDIAQWGLGMDGSGPIEIYPPDAKEYQYLTYKYDNGVIMDRIMRQQAAGVEFVGSEGRVLVNRNYLETDPPYLVDEPIGPNEIRLYESPGHQENWLHCLRTRGKPICDVAIGHRSATVCHLGNIAYWLKRPLKWDPVAERFQGDEEANRLLQRPMRYPWHL